MCIYIYVRVYTYVYAYRCMKHSYGLWTKSCMTLRTLNYGNYGIFLLMGHAGFCPSAVFAAVPSASSSPRAWDKGSKREDEGLSHSLGFRV